MLLAILAMVLLFTAVEGYLVFACFSPRSTFFKPALARGPAVNRSVALTFDDGPAPPFTEKILDILREKKVKATFFVCGKNVGRYPETLQRIVQEGHQVGNHTYSHALLFMKSPSRIAEQIDRAQEAIENACGVRPSIFRPPYGCRTPGLMRVLSDRGLKLVMWSAMGYDWRLQKDGIVRSVLRELKPGAIILLHDGRGIDQPEMLDRSNTQSALPEIIDSARQSGFSFVPLAEFFSF
jgi:peptidoglycan-N-acetylglucosamine deacetylase